MAAAIEDTSIDFGDFFKGPLPGKFLKLLGFLALSRLGIYIPLGGVNREAFTGSLDQNSILSTLDSFSGGGIGRLGICSLGIVPFINASIVFQLLTQLYPKLQDLQKREGEAGRKKILQYTRYASVGFAIVQVLTSLFVTVPVKIMNFCADLLFQKLLKHILSEGIFIFDAKPVCFVRRSQQETTIALLQLFYFDTYSSMESVNFY